MTAVDRFDPFAGRVADALEGIAPASRPAYLDEVLAQTARTPQRPRWTFPGRWLPMQTVIPRSSGLARVPVRPLLILLLLLLLAAAVTALWAGSQPRVPSPFGLAANGRIAYTHAGDIWVRDTLDGGERVLVAADGDQSNASFSPDGQWLSYVTSIAGNDEFMVARADGSGGRRVAEIPRSGNAQAAWRPDSKAIGFIYDRRSVPHLSIVFPDGTPTIEIGMPGLIPLDLAWRPPNGAELLVRAKDAAGATDLYLMRSDGTDQRPLGLPIKQSGFGSGYTNSGAAWSPDGSTIAYNAIVREPGSDGEVFRVHLVDADGSNERPLPGPPSDPLGRPVHVSWPVYSPDGSSILVHNWHMSDQPDAQGWLAVMPSDGSAPPRDIGPHIPGGNDTGLIKTWSPDGTQVLMRTDNTTTAYSIDPVSGLFEALDWTHDLPDWQRVAP
jgi:hypothetical protein